MIINFFTRIPNINLFKIIMMLKPLWLAQTDLVSERKVITLVHDTKIYFAHADLN